MNTAALSEQEAAQRQAIARYYRVHAKIYDLTRWTFLWGREPLMRGLAARLTPARILEVGCGTGKNLLDLGRLFPDARLWGVDLSAPMLTQARNKLATLADRVTLVQAAYDRPTAPENPFDLVVFSYALSMFNPGWEQALAAARDDLSPGGTMAVVDFHDSPFPSFKRWMGLNHVRLEAHLLPGLQQRFPRGQWTVSQAYMGLWSYFYYIGTKMPS
jgi:S-adenosylmethionine-diacylgycerolhomoserine-N-methlytransferase